MKIAIATNDGKTISRHLGRAPYYLVFTVDGSQLLDKERREKPGRWGVAHKAHRCHPHEHELGAHSEFRRTQMMEMIRDCEAIIVADVICATSVEMKEIDIRPFVTELDDADQAVREFIDGQLDDYTDWLH